MYLTFDDKWRTDKMGLEMTGFYIPMPAPKTNLVDIPTKHGSIDLTDRNGYVLYSNRDGVQFTFDIKDGTYEKWLEKYSNIASILHGKRTKVVCSKDSDHYYMMRLSVDSTKSNPFVSQIVLSGTADPFKYASASSVMVQGTNHIVTYEGITETPCTLSILPASVLSKLTITGLSQKPIILNNLEAEKEIVIDGEKGNVICEGANEFGDYDAWEFPRLLPGENTVTLDSDICQVTITYKPLYL